MGAVAVQQAQSRENRSFDELSGEMC